MEQFIAVMGGILVAYLLFFNRHRFLPNGAIIVSPLPLEAEDLLQQGIQKHRDGKLEAALLDFEAAEAIAPRHVKILDSRVRVLFALSRWQAAVDDLNILLEVHRHNHEMLRWRAIAYTNLEDYPNALADFEQLLRFNPNDQLAYLNRANLFLKQHSFENAHADINMALRIQPDWADAYAMRGYVFMEQKLYTEAIEALTASLESNDLASVEQPVSQRAIAYSHTGQYDEAVADLKYVLKENPDANWVYGYLGLVYIQSGDDDKALMYCTKAIEREPDTAANYINRAKVYRRLQPEGYNELALADYTQSLEIKPDDAQIILTRANVLLELERYDEAQVDIQSAIAIDPDLPNVYYTQGNIYKEEKKHAEAIEQYQKALERDPDFTNAYFMLGFMQHRIGNYTEAIDFYTQYVEHVTNEKDKSPGYNNRAWAKAALGDLDGAMDDVTLALELDDSKSYSYGNRGQTQWLRGNYAAALADFDKGMALDKENPQEFHASRSVALYALGREDEAIATWHDVQNSDDDLTTAQTLQDEHGYARAFFEAMQAVEALTNKTSS